MNEEIKCPVCGKVGISDYHKEYVICSCCGTDLSIYKMLSDSQKKATPQKSSSKWWKLATAVLTAVVIISTILAFGKDAKVNDGEDDGVKNIVVELKDSIQILSNQLEAANKEIISLKQKHSVTSERIYIVKKNDSPCKISKKLYGTERRYKEIEAIITKPLQPGDTLYLKKR
jgi:hypothetical protein